ncbi:tripartite tricarboxylate transporter TctB family protein [Actibacterium sp. MT2.3-13A]|uniref:tripartite tricarboxylate transporter TctB family protein n=1 Tax=Actibacterium sp. MT2.3-13A TaxID=2828332 RepID=UPI001BA8D6A3|nr:tripartite tricarboxylate transporter TctB family protein [Actibacterium sp. MT2.3-13A]
MNKLDQKNLTTIAMIGLFAAAIAMALALPGKAAAMPLVVAVPGLLMCIAQLAIDVLKRPVRVEIPVEEGTEAGDEGAHSERAMFIWLGLFGGAILGFGFLVGGSLIVLIYVGWSHRRDYRHALFAGIGTFAILIGVFKYLLELQLFEGLILRALLQ